MIAVSALLVFVAIALLVVGMLKVFVLVYASIGVSVLAAILLGVGAFTRRAEIFGRGDDEAAAGDVPDSSVDRREEGATPSARASAAVVAPAPAGGGAPGTKTEPAAQSSPAEGPAPAADIPADAAVFVLPSRRSYHLDSCRQLRTRENRELPYASAVAEGYTACSACMPDTVLAARGNVGASATSEHDAKRDALAAYGLAADDPTADGAGADGAAAGGAAASGAVAADAPSLSETSSGEGAEESGGGQAGLVGVVHDSRRYHRLTCAVIEDAVQDGIETTTMGRGEAEEQELVPCTVCRP